MLSTLKAFFAKDKKVGIDVIAVSRFSVFVHDKDHHFLAKTFTQKEIDHCFSRKNPAPSLAGIFAAKEAVSKALGVEEFPFLEIEIEHHRNGAPYACKAGVKLPVGISISHTDDIATAIALG